MKSQDCQISRFESLNEMLASLPERAVCRGNRAFIDKDVEMSGWLCSDRPTLTTPRACLNEIKKLTFDLGVSRLNKLASNISIPALTGVRRRLCRTFEGDELNQERVWQGELDRAWAKAKRLETQGPRRILINLDVCASADVDSACLSWRGSAAVSLAKALVEAGHIVQLEVRSLSELLDIAKTQRGIELVAKGATDSFDEHKLASLFCSSLYFRGIECLFAVNTSPTKIGVGTGYPKDPDLLKTSESFDYVISLSKHDKVEDKESAQGWINRALAKLELK